MRGKHCCGAAAVVTHRIIPAHAGQTPNRGGTGITNADHPRACGANVIGRYNRFSGGGSSPRMRGKLGRLFGRRLR